MKRATETTSIARNTATKIIQDNNRKIRTSNYGEQEKAENTQKVKTPKKQHTEENNATQTRSTD